MKLGLALSGGGVRGSAHIGVLKALEEANIRPDYISGASAGSIVASLYSIGYTPEQMQKIFVDISKKLIDYDYFLLLRLIKSAILQKNCGIDGLVKGNKLERAMEELAKNNGKIFLSQSKIPLAIPAVDVNTSELIIFSSQNIDSTNFICNTKAKISQAVRASVSFPGIFKPKLLDGRRLIDGGVRDNVPVNVLKEMGAEKVVAVNLGYCGEHEWQIDNILEIPSQVVDIMAYSLFKNNIDKIDFIIKPQIYDVKLLEIDKIPECIQKGYIVAKGLIPSIKKQFGI